jgi:hypothetical protein
MLLEEIREEKQFQHCEDNKQLDEDNSPQRTTQAHVAEAIGVEVVGSIEKTFFSHRHRILFCKYKLFLFNFQINKV